MTAASSNYPLTGFAVSPVLLPKYLSPNRAPLATDLKPAGTRWQDDSVSPPVVYFTTGSGVWYQDIMAPVSASGAASGAVIANGRSGAVSFTSPSIAGGAAQTLTITNSFVSSSSVIMYSIAGATTGAALSVDSITNSAGSSAVSVTNGTGATTQAATITLYFIILN